MSVLKWINVALRGIMETGIVLGLAFWGYHMGETVPLKIVFMILAPVIGFGFWGLVDFHQLGRNAEYFRLTQELLICGLVTYLIYISELHLLAWIFGILSVVYHLLVYISGDRILKEK
jgi:vacuolar-type H+-ATPase subunit I/STV1